MPEIELLAHDWGDPTRTVSGLWRFVCARCAIRAVTLTGCRPLLEGSRSEHCTGPEAPLPDLSYLSRPE